MNVKRELKWTNQNNRENIQTTRTETEEPAAWKQNIFIHAIWVPEKEEEMCGTEKVFKEIMAKKFPNLSKATNWQIQEAE